MHLAAIGRFKNPSTSSPYPLISEQTFLDAVMRGEKWIKVGSLVVDLGPFLEAHPGGPRTLLMNVGRDATTDFEHVPAHTRESVTRKLAQLAVGQSAPLPADAQGPKHDAWRRLIDHILLVRNGLMMQLDDNDDLQAMLVNCGQSYSQLVEDHVPSFCRALGGFTPSLTPVEFEEGDAVTDAVHDAVRDVLIGERQASPVISMFKWGLRALETELLPQSIIALAHASDSLHNVRAAKQIQSSLRQWRDDQQTAWRGSPSRAHHGYLVEAG